MVHEYRRCGGDFDGMEMELANFIYLFLCGFVANYVVSIIVSSFHYNLELLETN